MKRLRLLPILIGLLLAGLPLQAQQSDFRPDYGMLNGRRYMNGYFGFSYRFPEGWNGSALRYPAVGESKMYPLFSANPQAASTSDMRYVSINADYLAPNTTIRSPKDFLELAVNAQVGASGEFEALHTDKRYVFGGKQFYRVDMKAKAAPGTPVFYQTLIATILRGYAITFSFMAANDDDMEELVRTMESLSFVEPGQMSAPPNTAVAPQQTPAGSSVASGTTTARAPSTVLSTTTLGRSNETSAQPSVQPPAVSQTTSATPAAASSSSAAAPSKTPPKKSSAAEMPTADVRSSDIPLNQVGSNLPAAVTIEEAAPAPSATITATSPMAANALSSNATAPAPAPASSGQGPSAVSAPVHAAAPSTLISMGRTYPTTEPAKVAATGHAAAPEPAVSTANPASPPASVPTQPVAQTAKPVSTSSPNAASPAVSEFAASQPTSRPAESMTAPSKPASVATTAVAAPPLPSTAAQNPVMRVHVPPAELDQYIIRKTSPVYPMIAKAAGVQGMVVLDIVVDGKGNLQKVSTVNGSALLARAAEEALRQWRFKPYLVDGNPVEMESQISMNFRLTK